MSVCCFLVTYIYCRDGAGGVVGDELDVHVYPGKEVRGLRPKRGPHYAVQGQRNGLIAVAIVEELRLAKQYLELVRRVITDHRRGGGD